MSSNRYRHSIYGVKPRVVLRKNAAVASSVVECYNPCPSLLDSFLAFEEALFNTERTLQQYYQPNRAIADFIANMTARCGIPPVVFVRLAWRQAYQNTLFDINNAIHRLQIKDIYLSYNFEYRNDPLFKDALGLTLV